MEITDKTIGLKEQRSFTITIGCTNIKLSFDVLPDWFQKFDDLENVFLLHRWGWLLMAAVENPSRNMKILGIKIMKDWFVKMDNNKNHPVWDSYSNSERIANALLFFYVLRYYTYDNYDDLLYLEHRLLDMAVNLKDHLEFHGILTNNHILNNARSMYMLGVFSSCDSLANIGRQIFVNETPKMILSGGFLREDSASYHLLLLRTYLEVLWAAEYCKDTAFYEEIKKVALSMVKAGWFFNIYDATRKSWGFPLIGDISPDFPVEWLNSICFSEPAQKLYNTLKYNGDNSKGWNQIWNSDKTIDKHPEQKRNNDSIIKAFNESGWYRVDFKDVTIYWHINTDGCIPLFSHGHNDVLSFVLYWNGIPIIVDPGRFNYSSEQIGIYGKCAQAHNTFTIDSLDPYPLTRYKLPTKYRKGKPVVSYEDKKDGVFLSIGIDGFKRIHNSIAACREFSMNKNTLRIRDNITGKGSHRINTFFHFGENLRIELNPENPRELHLYADEEKIEMDISINGLIPSVKIFSGVRNGEPSGWYFPNYGKSIPINTCIIGAFTELPYNAEFNITFPG